MVKKFPEVADIIHRNCYSALKTHVDILRHVRDAVRRNSPPKWRTNGWFLLHDNAPVHRSVLVKDFFLAKKNATTLEHLPYSCDLIRMIFTFPSTEITIEGRHFCAAADVIKNATEELKRLSQNGFQECFQHLYSPWLKCIVAHGYIF
jgi:hypothetical protein